MRYHLCSWLGQSGWLGNQLWHMAATIAQARERRLEPRFPLWKYRWFFRVPADCFIDFTPIESSEVDGAYYQRLSYFAGAEPIVQGWFRPARGIPELLRREYPEIANCVHTTAVHIRRGDYLWYPDMHPVMPMAYYRRAAEAIRLQHPETTFVVFSDDIAWCRSGPLQEALGERVIFQEAAGTCPGDPRSPSVLDVNELVDLFLMMGCDRHIIANSTFSWWGAYLSNDPAPIYPSVWFGPTADQTEWPKMFDDRWVKIDATAD